MPPEFSRPVRIDTVGPAPRSESIEADAAERAALAVRFDLEALEALGATASVQREAAGILVAGEVRAHVSQRCVATEQVLPPVTVREPFRLLFVSDTGSGDEVELSEDELDVLPLEGSSIDLGEIAAETLALALDPYPRAPDADALLREAGVKTEAEAGPFGALAGLRDKLSER